MLSQCNVISRCVDVINDVITHAHAAGHMTFWYKKGRTQRGVGSAQDLQEVGLLKVCIGSDASGASLQLEPTAFNCI